MMETKENTTQNLDTFFAAIDNINICLTAVFSKNQNLAKSERVMFGQLMTCFFEAYSQTLFLSKEVSKKDKEALVQAQIFEQEVAPLIYSTGLGEINESTSVIKYMADMQLVGEQIKEYIQIPSLREEMQNAVKMHYRMQKAQ